MNLKQFKVGSLTVNIHHDDDPYRPEQDEDVFICTTNNRYFDMTVVGFELDDIRAGKFADEYDHFPLYMYAHSGVTISMSPFSCQWDSGQCGYVLAKKGVFEDTRKAAESYVKSWDQYLCGEVYGFTVIDEEGEELDACWGFYGIETAREEAKRSAEHSAANGKKKFKRLVLFSNGTYELYEGLKSYSDTTSINQFVRDRYEGGKVFMVLDPEQGE